MFKCVFMNKMVFLLKFHWCLFLRDQLTIWSHVTACWNKLLPGPMLTHTYDTGLWWVKAFPDREIRPPKLKSIIVLFTKLNDGQNTRLLTSMLVDKHSHAPIEMWLFPEVEVMGTKHPIPGVDFTWYIWYTYFSLSIIVRPHERKCVSSRRLQD